MGVRYLNKTKGCIYHLKKVTCRAIKGEFHFKARYSVFRCRL